MREEQILDEIQDYYKDDSLVFQIIIQDSDFHIYINREAGSYINYDKYKNTIPTAISCLDLEVERIYLYR